MNTLEGAIAYWRRRYENEPEPIKSFCREHLKQLISLQSEQEGRVDWQIHFDSMNKIWNWYLDLPNGWTASVSDDSQFGFPKRPTHYLAAAVSRTQIIQAKEYRLALSEAKQEAIELAAAQPGVQEARGERKGTS